MEKQKEKKKTQGIDFEPSGAQSLRFYFHKKLGAKARPWCSPASSIQQPEIQSLYENAPLSGTIRPMKRVFITRYFKRWMRKTELTNAALCAAVLEMTDDWWE